jgi:hypothetical protein
MIVCVDYLSKKPISMTRSQNERFRDDSHHNFVIKSKGVTAI